MHQILKILKFDKYVVTHSQAVDDIHDHRFAVKIIQQPLFLFEFNIYICVFFSSSTTARSNCFRILPQRINCLPIVCPIPKTHLLQKKILKIINYGQDFLVDP